MGRTKRLEVRATVAKLHELAREWEDASKEYPRNSPECRHLEGIAAGLREQAARHLDTIRRWGRAS